MATLKLTQYSGEYPRLIPRLLPDSAAQTALNVRLEDGGLTPIRKKRFEANITNLPAGSIETIYRHQGTWRAWSTRVDAAPGPVADDRLYYTGDGAPKVEIDGNVYPLAVPQPDGSLTGAVSGAATGTDTTTLIYVYTWVTQWGEESAPCDASNYIDWKAGQTVTLSGFNAVPAGRGITKQRIYRTQTGNTTSGLYFIAERDASNANYADVVNLDAAQELIPSIDWTAPPDTMAGLIALPNGMMAAFDGKDLLFCEPWRPHAWPDKYKLTADYPIVALGSFGSTVVVMTTGMPYIASGLSPDTMVMQKMEVNLPCINPEAVVSLGGAVVYPSYDGLVLASANGASVASGQLFTRSAWIEMQPATMIAEQFGGRYFSAYRYLTVDDKQMEGTLEIDFSGQMPFLIRTEEVPDAMFYDLPGGALYLLNGTVITEWDAVGQSNETLTWRSKQFVMPKPTNFGAIFVDSGGTRTAEEQAAYQADLEARQAHNEEEFALDSIQGEINGAAVGLFPMNGDTLDALIDEPFVSINIYGDSKLIANVSSISKMARLPADMLARIWEIEVSANTPISEITLATNAKELALV